jgi:F-type H+-transporting ATPase subunit gamma
LNDILINLLASDNEFDSPYAQQREVKKTAIVAFTSNSSLCGAFNANILKELASTYSDYRKTLASEDITIYPIGKKVTDFVRKRDWGYVSNPTFNVMADRPAFAMALDLSKELIAGFLSKEIDEITLIYTHFHSMSVQRVTKSAYLPFDLKSVQEKLTQSGANKIVLTDYILEPSEEKILSKLIPKVLASNLYAALLDSNASEHAARSLAMQIATDNATDLVAELTIEYNKSRQAAITNELLDIIGGASALEQ